MKIISMVPSWTETLLECGVEVAGRTRFCIHPAQAVKSVPVVGGTKDVNWSRVKELNADVLLLDREENPKFMADESPLPLIATHVTSVTDVAKELQSLAQTLKHPPLGDISRRWIEVCQKSKAAARFGTPAERLIQTPGVLEWIKPPPPTADSFIYMIWHKPWMAVSRGTFIGSMFAALGLSDLMIDFDSKYPELDLKSFDPARTVLLCSTEPFPFARKKHILSNFPFSTAIVDGEAYGWFGVRSLNFLEKQT